MHPPGHEQERLLRQAAIALLAVPIIAAVYIGAFLRRQTLARVGLAVGLALVFGIGVVGAGRPAITVAGPTTPILPLTQAEFRTAFSTDRGLKEPVTIEFSTPMDRRSVAASVTVEPPTPVDLAWGAGDTALTISPRSTWQAGTFHTVTVRAGALAATGQPLERPARAVFLTRDVTTGTVLATDRVGTRVTISTSFVVSFAEPVDPATVETAMRLDPPTLGAVRASNPAEGPVVYTFVPAGPLVPDVDYRLIVSGVRDLDGVSLDTLSLAVRTVKAPTVVRFRPRADTLDVARDTAISIRFTQAMDQRSTARAFAVTVGGAAITGRTKWAESDTVLVFTPAAQLPAGATVAMDVGSGARSTAGVPLGAPGHGTFKTVGAAPAAAAPKAPAPAPKTTHPVTKPPPTGGGAVGGGSWGAIETYYLGLMNCTRTGGWVTSSGSCSSPGGRSVAALRLDSGISSKVSRPYAKRLAVGNDCSHFIGGTPGDRLRHAGYTSYRWAENIGCRSGSPKSAVLGSHLFFQSEKSYSGGHYVNLMNAMYDRVGIGVWVYSGRVRLVIDFYHP
jgi:uncharacterized protein YkwD